MQVPRTSFAFRNLTRQSSPAVGSDPVDRYLAEDPVVAEREAYRALVVPTVFGLAQRLNQDDLPREQFGRTAQELSRLALRAPDKLTRRLARQILAKKVQWNDAYQDLRQKLGPRQAALRHLDRALNTVIHHSRQYYLSEDFLAPALREILDYPDDTAFRMAAQLGHGLYGRIEAELPEEIREKESPEVTRKLAGWCSWVLEEWHERGDLEIEFRESVSQVLQHGRVTVQGGSLTRAELPSGMSPELESLLDQIPWWERDDAPGIAELDRLAFQEPGKARCLVTEMVDRLSYPDRDSLAQLTRILKEGSQDTRQLFEAHLDRMIRYSSTRAQTYELVDNLDGSAQAHYYEALCQRFPQVVDERLLREELEPLYFAEPNAAHHLQPTLRSIWTDRQDLMEASIRRCLERPAPFYPDSQTTRLLDMALEIGWNPKADQIDDLAGWTLVPVGLPIVRLIGL